MPASTPDEDEPSFKKLDFSRIRFPSDNLTIGTIRRVHSGLFDTGFETGMLHNFGDFSLPEHHGDGVEMLLFLERLLVVGGYADRRGIYWPAGYDPDATREDLAGLYCTYGLASGPQHAEQLIRDLMRDGALLANEKNTER
jgi:hypothetical protein